MSEIHESVGYLLAQLCKSHRYQADVGLNAIGLHVGQEMILARLWEEDGLSQSQLAGSLCVEPPTVTKMLTRMERGGLVERRADPADARVSRVYLTDASRNLHTHVNAAWGSLETNMLRGFDADEQIVLRDLLQRLLDNLSAE
ncbi:MAG: MarR family transcriptional regulator [Anaerolineae bacterium]|nr:MarR family transcriptional regulator [Anaerolineae bacterium]